MASFVFFVPLFNFLLQDYRLGTSPPGTNFPSVGVLSPSSVYFGLRQRSISSNLRRAALFLAVLFVLGAF